MVDEKKDMKDSEAFDLFKEEMESDDVFILLDTI